MYQYNTYLRSRRVRKLPPMKQSHSEAHSSQNPPGKQYTPPRLEFTSNKQYPPLKRTPPKVVDYIAPKEQTKDKEVDQVIGKYLNYGNTHGQGTSPIMKHTNS